MRLQVPLSGTMPVTLASTGCSVLRVMLTTEHTEINHACVEIELARAALFSLV